MPRAGLTIEGGGDAKGTLLTPVQKATVAAQKADATIQGVTAQLPGISAAAAAAAAVTAQNTPAVTPVTPTAAPTASGNPVLSPDGYYYQPMSDGSWVKGVQGQDTRNTSALTDIQTVMNGVGLAGLATKAYQDWKNGVPVSEIMDTIQRSPDYAQRFPGMADLAKRGQRISEANYIAKETQDSEIMKQFGLPQGLFDDRVTLGKLIAGQVSSTELQARVQAAHDSVLSADPAITQYLKDNYGLSQGDLTAFWLNPELALADIERRSNAGMLGGIGRETGFGNLTTSQAETLANQGVTDTQARAKFGQLGQMGQLQQNLPGSETGSVNQQQLLDAGFSGDANAQQAVNRVMGSRKAIFDEGGGFAGNNAGISGLGTSVSV
jgi:hypothetical protein